MNVFVSQESKTFFTETFIFLFFDDLFHYTLSVKCFANRQYEAFRERSNNNAISY